MSYPLFLRSNLKLLLRNNMTIKALCHRLFHQVSSLTQ